MARLAVLRGFLLNELTIAHRHKLNHCYGSRLYSSHLRCSARFSSSTAGNERTEQEEQSRQERIRREKRYVGLIIGSSVGLIGSLYFMFRRLTMSAKAEGKTASIDSINSENTMDQMDKKQGEADEETDGEKKKDKQGFKERRVRR